jgi:hypothetical protein
MKTPLRLPFALLAVAVAAVAEAQTPITPVELAGPECSISGGNISFTVHAEVKWCNARSKQQSLTP